MAILLHAHPSDGRHLTALRRHLDPAAKRLNRRVFCSETVLPGDDLEASLRRAVDQSCCVLALVSSHLMADAGCQRLLEYAFTRHDQSRTLVIPVLVGAVTLTTHRLAQQKALDIGISKGRAQDTAWKQVVEAVLAQLPPRLPAHGHGAPAEALDEALSEQTVAPVGPCPPRLDSDPGEALCRYLFPQGPPGEDPTLQPVRLRIRGDAPDLCALPFWLTAHQGYRLREFGWTFEILAPSATLRDHELPAVYRCLALAPARLTEILRERLGREDMTVLPTLPRLRDRLAAEAPHVLYLHDAGRIAPAELDELLRPLRAAPPTLACLSGDPGHRAAAALAPHVPFVLSVPGPDPLFAGRFLQKVLREGVEALTCVRALLAEGVPAGGPPQIFSSCRRLNVPVRRVLESAPHLRLDRDAQRALVLRHVRGLQGHRRLEVILAYGAGGNLLDKFSAQAIDELELDVPVKRLCPPFPGERDGLARRLEQGLRTLLDDRRGDRLDFLLRRHAPRGGSGTPVLWLDFGTFGQRHPQRLSAAQVAEWVHFCYELSTESPGDVRVVAYLAMEVMPERLDELEKDLRKRVRDLNLPSYEHFRFTILPRLEEVGHDDLQTFLSDRRSCRCPPALARDLADLIHQKTGGVYEATVAELDLGDRRTWWLRRDELRQELRGAPPAPAMDDDVY